jgi:AcrR family transcriptional regulator
MSDKSVSSNKKRERRDRTEEILKTATRLFSEKGFRGTSLASIAVEVGLTEPGLLHYFPTKVKLLQGVLEYREKEDEQKYMHLVDPESPDFKAMLDVLHQLVTDNQQKPAIIRLFTVLVAESIRADHPSHDHFVNRYNLGRQVYSQLFRRLQDEGQIRTDIDPEQIGILFLSIMDGLQVQWLLDPENVDMTESFTLFSTMISNFLTDQND